MNRLNRRIIGFSLFAVSSLSAFAAEQLYHHQPTVTPELAFAGKLPVGVSTITVTNPKQLSAKDFTSVEDRTLTLEVWYPAEPRKAAATTIYKNMTRGHNKFELQGVSFRDATATTNGDKYPLIVLSHGYTGYRTIMFYLGEHLASHGYVVAAIDHTDSTNAEIDFANSPSSGFPSTLINRARDQQFVLDYFGSGESRFTDIVDADRAAVVGYSMGGYGAINTVGSCYAYTEAALMQFGTPKEAAAALLPVFNSCNGGREKVDPRWKAMMAFSPWGGELAVHDAASMAKIRLPTMYVSGDQDDISGFENGVKKLFEQTGSEHNYLMVYENARHNIVAHPAPAVAYTDDLDIGHHFEPSWSIETLNRINRHMSLAFFDCHVKKITRACSYLPEREDITQIKDSSGKLNEAWPGFPERWGTGVKFYRSNKSKQ